MPTNNTPTGALKFTIGETFIGEGIINYKSTNNMNTTNNNASQTLFRFATMRNAELSDPKNKERRFIFRDYETQFGIFDEKLKLNSSTTLKKLCEKPQDLPLTILSEQSLKAQDPAFYELAVWIARNKASSTKKEFDEKFNEYKESHQQIIVINSSIWDNLVYQVVTQKDFYAKETLMQFLHLNHIILNYDGTTQEQYEDVIRAKVVLPKELFKPVNNLSANNAVSRMSEKEDNQILYNDKNIQFAEARFLLSKNQELQTKLEAQEKNYKKQYQEAYKLAIEAYEREVKPIRTEYERSVDEAVNRKAVVESRIKYINDLTITNPDTLERDPSLKEDLNKLNEELLEIRPISLELPDFNFIYESEIQEEKLRESLTAEEQNTFDRVLEEAFTSLSSISTFAEINQAIAQNNVSLQQTVLQNTVLNNQTFTTIGGVVVPVINNTPNTTGLIGYSVKTNNVSSSAWYIMLTLENFASNIISANYKVNVNGVNITSNTVFSPSNGVSFLFYSGTVIPDSQTLHINEFNLEGTVVLADGKAYNMDVTLVRDPSDINRFLKQGVFKGSSVFRTAQVDIGYEGQDIGNNDDIFIPSGFGMKNIGITDYKKVEQSTYCYVEGDVAHIENIMAREYKERATRRLKRSESQVTTSSETEKEKLTDTTSTERHEMQSEIAKILQESKDFAAQAGFNASWGIGDNKYGLSVGANYATHNSKEESNRQAVTEAKDITARALDRIVTKVKEERIDKIIEEFEENNKHGFDNTKGSSHVVGVYRWVDKVVKNQIYNYGKRMMFEFMIPEPAKLHNLGMKVSNNSENQLVKPVDPRSEEAQQMRMKDFSSLNNETILKYWLGNYNVEVDEKPIELFSIGKSLGGQYTNNISNIENMALKDEIQIPEGYIAISGSVQYTAAGDGDAASVGAIIGTEGFWFEGRWGQMRGSTSKSFSVPYSKMIPISATFYNEFSGAVSFTVDLKLTLETKNSWFQKVFNKIIEAYETELAKYEQALAEIKAMGVQIKGSNPGFYRKIENTILRRNCISYMLNQSPGADLTFGKKRYYTNDGALEETFTNTDILVDEKLDQYAAFIKFMEQAFEWEIMSYYFYPYYWGERKSWADLYQFDDNDPVFRSFMQSGMARVIVTVRPGFEEAVRHFLATGQIWNGGEVPVIDDPLFLSIVDEMRSPKATKEGEPWREKIPTSLTILQADSIGLRVEKALPCNCEPGVKFDDNLGEMCGSNFELNNNQIGQSSDKWMEITFDYLDDGNTNIGAFDYMQDFPRVYACLGNTITIDRDVAWLPSDSVEKIHKVLADEVSMIEGVEAYLYGKTGITLKINISKISLFTFRKPGKDDGYDLLKFSVDLQNSTLKIASPEYDNYGSQRILDKDGQIIPKAEYLDKVPLSKFLV
ncbi:hypothetical protein [Chryseobacterium salviniae]|uniref:Uncharacterized protein n=1 Tax=Chryseobacterium salviniae TaxID=3101750 RepID=A0ABU6HTW0_9FLAO|nr:hypothetical protein [Chryseobacterium sp. T9W2-O]MEC3876489.1 hypothetical protein [Chryseobacterium sp. T9W2-O]